MVNDNTVIDKVTLDDYLIKDFIPYVSSFYDTTVKAHTTRNFPDIYPSHQQE